MKTIVYLSLLLLVGCTTQAACPSPERSAFELSLRSADEAILEQTTEATSVLKANTATLEGIAAKIESMEASLVSSQSDLGKEVIKSEDTSPADNANDSQPVTRSVAEAGDVPLFVSVTNFCRPCNQFKRDWKAGKLKGFDVTFCVETETHQQQLIAENIPADRVIVDTWNGTPFPAIRYQSKEHATGWVAKLPHGYGPQVLHELRRDLLGINGEGIEYEYPQTSTGGEPVGSIFPYRADGEVRRQSNALRSVSWWTPRGWRQNFVSRQSGFSGAYP